MIIKKKNAKPKQAVTEEKVSKIETPKPSPVKIPEPQKLPEPVPEKQVEEILNNETIAPENIINEPENITEITPVVENTQETIVEPFKTCYIKHKISGPENFSPLSFRRIKSMYHTIVTLKKGEGRTIKAGGMWIYDNEIASILGDFENGDLVTVHDFDGYFMGYGFLNMNSKIRVRMMSRRKDQVIDEAFLERRVRNAWEYRKTVMGGADSPDLKCCRVIFGEADGFPGLTVDRFSEILVTQTLSLGIEQRKDIIFPLLVKILREDGQDIRAIYERNDVAIRKLEGMEEGKGER